MLETILMVVSIGIWVFSILGFLWVVPCQLKRIADALERKGDDATD